MQIPAQGHGPGVRTGLRRCIHHSQLRGGRGSSVVPRESRLQSLIESEVGFATAITRQNPVMSSVLPEPGRVNFPAETLVPDVIVTSGIWSFTKSLQLAADAGWAASMRSTMSKPKRLERNCRNVVTPPHPVPQSISRPFAPAGPDVIKCSLAR